MHPDLEERLRSLELPALLGAARRSQWEDWVAQPFAVPPQVQRRGAHSPASVELHRADDGFELTITEPANALTFAVGIGGWLVSAPRGGTRCPLRHPAAGSVTPIFASMSSSSSAPPHGHRVLACGEDRPEATWRPAPFDDGIVRRLARPR